MLNRNPKRAKRILKRHFKEDLFSLSAVQYILHLDIDTEITHRQTKTLPLFLDLENLREGSPHYLSR